MHRKPHYGPAGTALSYVPELVSEVLSGIPLLRRHGRIVELLGARIKAIMPPVRLGELCILRNAGGTRRVLAEVTGFSDNLVLLTPMTAMGDLSVGALVTPSGSEHRIQTGPFLLGRVLDGLGQPLDWNGPALAIREGDPVLRDPPNALIRRPVESPLITGIRAIDGLLTCGMGQRIGIFSAAGAGKSTLLTSLMRHARADICVLALIGERGREVRELLERVMTPDLRHRLVLVVATSDRPAMQRVRAAHVATTVAEYFRDTGHHVLLLMDSITRFARALREVGLAAGEAPTRRGYPASTFAELPRLLERAGPGDMGTITAMYTVLMEGEDTNDPLAEELQSLLDGHILLSRELASANRYPAIDVLQSVSRVMNNVVDMDHLQNAARIRDLMSRYKDTELLIQMGEYQTGLDHETDLAVALNEAIRTFLEQDVQEPFNFDTTLAAMRNICSHEIEEED